MAKYLIRANYTAKGTQGLLKDGGTVRREAIKVLAASVGGTLESFYYAFGETDAYVIVDLPSLEAAAAVGLTVAAGGRARVTTTVLLSPEDIDATRELSPEYRPPGS